MVELDRQEFPELFIYFSRIIFSNEIFFLYILELSRREWYPDDTTEDSQRRLVKQLKSIDSSRYLGGYIFIQ